MQPKNNADSRAPRSGESSSRATRVRWGVAAVVLGLMTAATAKPLRYAEDRGPAIVNPLFATSMSEARIHELVFEGLFADDLDLSSSPRLASSFIVAEDRLSMTIALRTDVAWHDGKPFVADDVVFTIKAMKETRTASTEASRVAWIKDVTVINPRTITLEFNEPLASPEDMLHFKILPAHAFESTVVQRSHPFRTHPVGTGPYKLTQFNNDNSISLEAFSGYPRPNGLAEVQMREVADKNYQSKLLLYGSLEALVRVLPRDLATLQADQSTELYPYQTNSWWYMGFNLDDSRFSDPRVREAINLMVDRDALLAPIGTGDLLSGPFVRSSPFYNHRVPVRSQDGARAKQLLQEAGWRMVEGRWTIDGEPVVLRLSALARQETVQDVVINLQSQLKKHGLHVRQDFMTTAEWKSRVWGERNFDLMLSQWSFDRNEDIYEQFHSEGNRNFVGFHDDKVDGLLTAARTSLDPQVKRDTMRQTHARIHELSPMVFLWTLDTYAAMSTSVDNVTVHPFYFFTWSSSWSME